jgi:hypothetical protein
LTATDVVVARDGVDAIDVDLTDDVGDDALSPPPQPPTAHTRTTATATEITRTLSVALPDAGLDGRRLLILWGSA